MIPTPQDLAREAAATGFGAEPLAKVHRLLALLDALGRHSFARRSDPRPRHVVISR